jgi:hypothetical protein
VGGDQALPVGFGAVAARSAEPVRDEDRAGEEKHHSGQDDHVDPPVVIRRAGVYRDRDGLLCGLADLAGVRVR